LRRFIIFMGELVVPFAFPFSLDVKRPGEFRFLAPADPYRLPPLGSPRQPVDPL